MTLRAQVLSAIRWYAALRALGQLFTWAASLMVVRLLTPESFGLAALAMLPIGLITLINELGLGAAVVQRPTLEHHVVRQAMTIVLGGNLVLALATVALAPVIASFFSEAALVSIVSVLSLQFLVAALGVIPEALVIRAMNFKAKSIVEMLAAVGGSLTTLVLAWLSFGAWALVWGSIATATIKATGMTIAARQLIAPTLALRGARDILHFGGLITLDRILWYVYARSDIFVAGRVLGSKLVGSYSVAMDIASLPMQKVNGILNEIAFPAFARIQTQPGLVEEYVYKSVRVVSFIAFPVFVGIAVVAADFVPLVLGEQWLAAAPLITMLALVMPLRMVSNITTATLQGIGRADTTVVNLLIATVLMPTAFVIGVRHGTTGLAWAWIVGYPCYFAIELARSAPVLGVKRLRVLACLWPGASAAAVMAGAVLLAGHAVGDSLNAWVRLALLVLIGVAAFGAMSWVLGRATLKEVIGLARP